MPVLNKAVDSSQRVAAPVRKPFAEWTLADTKNAVEWVIQRRLGRDGFDSNRMFAHDHDHFQNGSGWIGPTGGEATLSQSKVKGAVERQFTPVDAIAEVLDNLANALLQNKATVALLPIKPAEKNSEEEKAQQTEARDLMAIVLGWADKRQLWGKTREAVKRSRWATWGTLRSWIPESAIRPDTSAPAQPTEPTSRVRQILTAVSRRVAPMMVEQSEQPDELPEQQTTIPLPTNLTLEEALDKIYLSAPSPDQGFVYVDPDSQKRVAIFLTSDDRDEYAELRWLDDQGQTVFRTLSRKNTEAGTVTLDLGRHLTMDQMEAELLITQPVRMQQAQLNFANSVMTRVMETAGFPERYVKDAMPEGELTDVVPTGIPALKATVDDNGKQWYLVPTQRTLGAGIQVDIRSMTDIDDQGKEVARNAEVIKFDPTDPDYIIKAKADARATVLRQCKQGHVEMDDQATATGWSRVQARATHIADVTNMREPLANMLRETFEGVLAYASLMSADAKAILAKFKVTVTIYINIGPVSPEERTAILEMYKAGVLSLETTLLMLQVDDVTAEIERIRSQPESQRATMKAQAEIMGILIRDCQLDQVTAAELAGFPPDLIAKIKKAVADLDAEREAEEERLREEEGDPGDRPPGQRPPGNRPPAARQGAAA